MTADPHAVAAYVCPLHGPFEDLAIAQPAWCPAGDGHQLGLAPPGRRCEWCPAILSRYNPGHACGPCRLAGHLGHPEAAA